MKIIQAFKTKNTDWQYFKEKVALKNPIVFVFANRILLEDENILGSITDEFPYEHIVYGSTAGEIFNTSVLNDSVTVIAIEFEKSFFVIKKENIFKYDKDTKRVAEALTSQMPQENLKHLFVLSEGSFVNGTLLINSIEEVIDHNTSVTGALCGDDSRFERTIASYNEKPMEGEIVLIGFYGESLEISSASYGGWQPFGPERLITKSKGNILYEIDGQPALKLYKKYLGDKADNIAESTLLYPLNILVPGKSEPVVRTILSIDTNSDSMTFAGDVPQGSLAQLMMVSPQGIAHGAAIAAKHAMEGRKQKPELALVISCIGRKLVMGQRAEEEIEQVGEIIGEEIPMAGFYSYGEIAPFLGSSNCELHNQTMTLTLISE
ncbi:FIST signal transduction protein [Flavobacterium psychrotrophum]|uniref:FIST signal transduction protein n=1 Tax=Flavobacterium psychrotrophum TaxID=2294119 RepID=UPI000E318B0E|nr:FIST N-terminal domain-containing protein [Flavobacterium psychrotrophum]